MQDVIRMIVQYLQDEGYVASIMTIQDETSVRFAESLRNRSHFKRIKAAILGMFALLAHVIEIQVVLKRGRWRFVV